MQLFFPIILQQLERAEKQNMAHIKNALEKREFRNRLTRSTDGHDTIRRKREYEMFRLKVIMSEQTAQRLSWSIAVFSTLLVMVTLIVLVRLNAPEHGWRV
jgi:hypothetical protein